MLSVAAAGDAWTIRTGVEPELFTNAASLTGIFGFVDFPRFLFTVVDGLEFITVLLYLLR